LLTFLNNKIPEIITYKEKELELGVGVVTHTCNHSYARSVVRKIAAQASPGQKVRLT
jgi:hypothetical protein